MKVIITIKLHFFMVVAYFIQSDFLKTSLAKLTTLRWKRAKRQDFLCLIITAKHHIQPPSTRILIFFNPQHFWSILKKIPPTQIHVFKPIHWTPLGIFVASVPCLRVVVSFVRVIVLSSSGHRWPFSRFVNPFRRLLRGCVVFMSSCRPFFLSSTLLHI